MLYNNEDEYLKIFADKISKLNPRQPSSDEWTALEMAYRKHKKQNKKWPLLLWFGLFSMLCVGLIYFSNNQKISIEKAIGNNSLKAKSENNATINKDTNKKLIGNTTTKAQNLNENKVIDRNVSDYENKSKQIEKLKNPLNKKETIKVLSKVELLSESNTNKPDVKPNHNILFELTSLKLKSFQISTPLKKIITSTKPTNNAINSIKTNASNNITKSSQIAKYFELGICIQNNNFKQLDYPSDQFFKGVGLNAGLHMDNKWSINLGISALYLKQVKIDKFVFQTEEQQIERIDTTIKYNNTYNRLMMEFDTVLSYKNVNHEGSSIYKNDIVFIHLPFQVRYHIGNEKRSVYVAIGAIGTITYQSQNITKNIGLSNEGNQSKDTYSFMFAPTIGLGCHQKIYKNWALHLASNYSKYLNSNLNQTNTFQLQTGLKYNF
jgi:opacity protein-like surface antigen